jgi:hypothetical protein
MKTACGFSFISLVQCLDSVLRTYFHSNFAVIECLITRRVYGLVVLLTVCYMLSLVFTIIYRDMTEKIGNMTGPVTRTVTIVSGFICSINIWVLEYIRTDSG